MINFSEGNLTERTTSYSLVVNNAVANNPATFQSFPEDVIRKIFSYLPPLEYKGMRLVCKKWKAQVPEGIKMRLRELEIVTLQSLATFRHSSLLRLLIGPDLKFADWIMLCQQMIVLDLANFEGDAKKEFKGIIGKNRHLHVLKCSYANLDDLAIIGLSTYAPSCQIIDLIGTKISDLSLTAISKNCPMLEEICLAFCKQISAIGVIQLLSACKRINDLDLSGFVQWNISLIDTLKTCSGIMEHLDISYPRNLYEGMLEALFYESSWPNLMTLYLWGCRITDEILKSILKSCPRLLVIGLLNCPRITDLGLEFISELGSDIVDLGFGLAPGITDQGLRYLSAKCYFLNSIRLADCPNITEAGIKLLIDKCPFLNQIKIENCTCVSPNFLEGVQIRLSKRKHRSI